MRRRTFLASGLAAAATPLVASCGARAVRETPPRELLRFGSTIELSADGAGAGQRVVLKALPGPSLALASGGLAIADPWFRDTLPTREIVRLPRGPQRTLLSTILVARKGKPAAMACAAAIGAVGKVADWQPLMVEGKPFWLDSDSALGAFYDIADAAALRPVFENDARMFGVYKNALSALVVPMEIGGRVAVVAFLCPDGSGLYPVYAGFDGSGQAVAVLVDLKILNPRRPWTTPSP